MMYLLFCSEPGRKGGGKEGRNAPAKMVPCLSHCNIKDEKSKSLPHFFRAPPLKKGLGKPPRKRACRSKFNSIGKLGYIYEKAFLLHPKLFIMATRALQAI